MATRQKAFTVYSVAHARREPTIYNDDALTFASVLGALDSERRLPLDDIDNLEKRLREAGMLSDATADTRALDAAEEDAALTRAGAGEVRRERDIAQAQVRALQELEEATRRELQQAKEALEQARAKVDELSGHNVAVLQEHSALVRSLRADMERAAAEMRERAASLVWDRTAGGGLCALSLAARQALDGAIRVLPLSPERPRPRDPDLDAQTPETRIVDTTRALIAIGVSPDRAEQAARIAEEEGGAAPETAHSAILKIAKMNKVAFMGAEMGPEAVRVAIHGMLPQAAGLSAEDAATLRGAGWTLESPGVWRDPADGMTYDSARPYALGRLQRYAAHYRAGEKPATAHGEPERHTGEVTAAAGTSSVAEEPQPAQEPRATNCGTCLASLDDGGHRAGCDEPERAGARTRETAVIKAAYRWAATMKSSRGGAEEQIAADNELAQAVEALDASRVAPAGGAAQGGQELTPIERAISLLHRAQWHRTADRLASGSLTPTQALEKVRRCNGDRTPDADDVVAMAALEDLIAPARSPHGLPKPPRVEVGQRWAFDGQRVAIDLAPGRIVRVEGRWADAHTEAEGDWSARPGHMLSDPRWRFLGPAPQGPTGGGDPEKSELHEPSEAVRRRMGEGDVAGALDEHRRDGATAEATPLEPTAADAVAGMLLRRGYPLTAAELAHGRLNIEHTVRVLARDPVTNDDRACIAALEALARGELSRPRHAGNLVAAIDRLTKARDQATQDLEAMKGYCDRVSAARDSAQQKEKRMREECDRIQREREQQGARLHELESAQSAGRGGGHELSGLRREYQTDRDGEPEDRAERWAARRRAIDAALFSKSMSAFARGYLNGARDTWGSAEIDLLRGGASTPAAVHLRALLELQEDVSFDRVLEVAGHEIEELRALGGRPTDDGEQLLHDEKRGVRLVIAKDADPREVLATVTELLGLAPPHDGGARAREIIEALQRDLESALSQVREVAGAAARAVQAERERQRATARGLAEKWDRDRDEYRDEAKEESGHVKREPGRSRFQFGYFRGSEARCETHAADLRLAFGLPPPDGGPGGGSRMTSADLANALQCEDEPNDAGRGDIDTGVSPPEAMDAFRAWADGPRGQRYVSGSGDPQRAVAGGAFLAGWRAHARAAGSPVTPERSKAEQHAEAPVSSPTSDVGGLSRDVALRLANDWADAADDLSKKSGKASDVLLAEGEARAFRAAAADVKAALGVEPCATCGGSGLVSAEEVTIQIDGRPVPVDLFIDAATALRDAGLLPTWRADSAEMWDVEATTWDPGDTVHATVAAMDSVECAMLRWRLRAGAHARMSRGAT